MRKFNLDDRQRNTLVHGLKIAAERFDMDAKVMSDAAPTLGLVNARRLAEQFKTQAADSRKLSVLIEDAGEVEISLYPDAG